MAFCEYYADAVESVARQLREIELDGLPDPGL
jgi:hypothetical protein